MAFEGVFELCCGTRRWVSLSDSGSPRNDDTSSAAFLYHHPWFRGSHAECNSRNFPPCRLSSQPTSPPTTMKVGSKLRIFRLQKTVVREMVELRDECTGIDAFQLLKNFEEKPIFLEPPTLYHPDALTSHPAHHLILPSPCPPRLRGGELKSHKTGSFLLYNQARSIRTTPSRNEIGSHVWV